VAQGVGGQLGFGEVLLREVPARMTDVVLLPYDRLSLSHGAMAGATPETTEILLIESEQMLRSRTWHAQRLFLLLSAAAHVAQDLRDRGFIVHVMSASSVSAGVKAFALEHPDARIRCTEPSSSSSQRALIECGVELVPDDTFLTSREEFRAWAGDRRPLVMETFYRWQRTRLGILIDNGAPVGGTWNLDKENRLPPPKGAHPWPEPPRHEPDDIDEQVWRSIVDRELPVTGAAPNGTWATTRAGALRQLTHFLDTSLVDFGPYEDAMPRDSWSVNHSLLSPYLNLGLITAREVIDAVVERFDQGGIPLASAEGFIRQVIGWREYVNGVYWLFEDDYRNSNELQADRPLLPLLSNPSRTQMACASSVVSDVMDRGWAHHIPRLMILSNLALIAGVQPQEFLNWMKAMFIDAADWVMVPNVIGMGLHADGGAMMTKPYAAGGAYVKRMGRFCSGCVYDPGKRVGETACPLTTLYWDFLDRNRATLKGNHRMGQQFAGLDRLSDLDDVRTRAREVLDGLSAGTI
jgi:deoxyribodipyrimidine photolyase-related protein